MASEPDDLVLFDYEEEERELEAGAAVLRYADYGGFWVRLVASLIDVGGLWLLEIGVVVGAWEIGLLPITEKELGEGLGLFLALMFWAFPVWPYYAYFESSGSQATPGKRLFGLRVVDQRGVRLSFGRASVRHFAKVLSAMPLYLGFVVIAFNEHKVGLHDVVAGTYVIWPPRRG
jgi:uncharacterized RDD family membrane protein YckC